MDVYHVCPISEIHTCKTGNVLILKKKKPVEKDTALISCASSYEIYFSNYYHLWNCLILSNPAGRFHTKRK